MKLPVTSYQAVKTMHATSAVIPHRSAAVIGAGPAGLLAAIMLSQRGWGVKVYDALPPPPSAEDNALWSSGERSYQLGLNGRGQRSLREFGVMERVSHYAASVNGRLSFDTKTGAPSESRLIPPGQPGAEKTYVTRVLQRDRLQACLLEEVRERYPNVEVGFQVACDGVDLSGERPAVSLCVSSQEELKGCAAGGLTAFDLVVGADGVRSAVREALAASPATSTRPVRFEDRNARRYKTLALHPSAVPGTSSDLNWGCRNRTLDLGMDALPTVDGEMVAVLLFKPGSAAYKVIEGLQTASEARDWLAEALPPLLPYVREADLEAFVGRPISRLPSFQLVEGDIHARLAAGGVVLLGDSIKAVKPYFGQGANSALEDVSVLARCLAACSDEPAAAAAAFTEARAEDARALVRTSRGFDGRGPLGTARFLVPLLLDLRLHALLPAVFTPPMLRGLQDERNTFTGLRRRKRLERALLAALVGGALLGARFGVKLCAKALLGAG